MTIIVSKGRFGGENRTYTPLADVTDLTTFTGNLDVASDTNPETLLPYISRLKTVRIDFPTSADGRGNSIAKALRTAGFTGPIRAKGHVLADQYPLALRNGFTDAEIDEALAARQPEDQWLEAYGRINIAYLPRLKSRPVNARAAA